MAHKYTGKKYTNSQVKSTQIHRLKVHKYTGKKYTNTQVKSTHVLNV